MKETVTFVDDPTASEIMAGNKLIAVFLGYTWYPFSAKNPTYTNQPGWKLHPASREHVSRKLEPFYNSPTIPPIIFSKATNFPGATEDAKPNPDYHPALSAPNTYLCRKHGELPFDNSYSWLFKVMDKVLELGGVYNIGGNKENGQEGYIFVPHNVAKAMGKKYIWIDATGRTRKVILFRLLVKFIEWYNEDNKPV